MCVIQKQMNKYLLLISVICYLLKVNWFHYRKKREKHLCGKHEISVIWYSDLRITNLGIATAVYGGKKIWEKSEKTTTKSDLSNRENS